MHSLGRAITALLLLVAVRLLRATWRVRVIGGPPAGAPGGRLYAFWHGDQLALTRLPRPLAALVSRSEDGELAARTLQGLGFAVVRGSSSRGAVAGALGLLRRMRAGQTVAVALDGPRGPRHRASDAALRLASRAGAVVVPVAAVARRALVLRSWDRLCVPAPFTRVTIVWGTAVSERLEDALGTLWRAAQQLGGPQR